MSVSFGGGYLKTKLELIRLRRSVRVAQRVYRILEDKRDVLVRRLNELIEEAQESRDRLTAPLSEAYYSILDAYMEIGPSVLDAISSTVPETLEASIGRYSMMGISFPTIEVSSQVAGIPYGFWDTGLRLDEAARKMRVIIPAICKAAATESAIFRLADELRKTQRLLNALENVVIPRYQEAIKNISMSLDESERDYFVKLKHIKAVLERRKIEAAPAG